jgi:hypothetical protein
MFPTYDFSDAIHETNSICAYSDCSLPSARPFLHGCNICISSSFKNLRFYRSESVQPAPLGRYLRPAPSPFPPLYCVLGFPAWPWLPAWIIYKQNYNAKWGYILV